MIRRKWLAKIPLQANFYPMTSAAYIQDPMMRMTVISGQALGVASLNPGQLEVSIQNFGISQFGVTKSKYSWVDTL